MYDPRAIAAEKNEKGRLEMQLKKQFVRDLPVTARVVILQT